MNWDRRWWPSGRARAWEVAVGSGQAGVASKTGVWAWEMAGESG